MAHILLIKQQLTGDKNVINDKTRILFGKERSFETLSNTCPECNTSRGHYHKYGCPLESCPKCHARLLTCTCKVLGVVDSMKMAKAVSTDITDKVEVHRALDNGSEHLDSTYYEEGVLLWIMDDVSKRDPSAAAEMEEHMNALGFKKTEGGYLVSAEGIAPHLNKSTDEARDILEELHAEAVYPDWQDTNGREQ